MRTQKTEERKSFARKRRRALQVEFGSSMNPLVEKAEEENARVEERQQAQVQVNGYATR